jgi:trans-AT polyketide synthase/acyltransferase/oxidoreductase domain-containing protein
MGGAEHGTVGSWTAGAVAPAWSGPALIESLQAVREPVHVVRDPATGAVGLGVGGQVGGAGYGLLGTLPPLYPEWLGDRSFCEVHGLRFPYIAGAMANGICTADIVIAMARAGMIGFFGAAGLSPERVEANLDRIQAELRGGESFGSNLIHSPNEPRLEEAVADLYLRKGVRRVSAAAYMGLTPAIVRYAYSGVREEGGRIVRQNYVFAKISRPETAARFMGTAPQEMLDGLVAAGKLTAQEAKLARRLPVAEDITVESDSGGHTDNRPLGSLFPTIALLRDAAMREHGWDRPIRVGAAGGLGTPQSVAAAFALGAAYVLTGSVNQSCVESGLSDEGKRQLAQAGIADVIMAPAADMFEMGVKVQVLRRGTMFAQRALKLYELYQAWPSIEAMPADVRAGLDKTLGRKADEIWAETVSFWTSRDPHEVTKAERDPKHKMALIFRWYLGLSSRWAIAGEPSRKLDYQIWCGPAMGAFNAWTAGTFLAEPAERRVVQVALNLLEGAACVTRAHQLRSFGAPVPPEAFAFAPRRLAAG